MSLRSTGRPGAPDKRGDHRHRDRRFADRRDVAQPVSSSSTRRSSSRRIEELADREQLPEPLRDQLVANYEQRIRRLAPEAEGHDSDGDDAAEAAQRLRGLRHELIGTERQRLEDLRRRGEISTHTQRRIEHELDLEESRLTQ